MGITRRFTPIADIEALEAAEAAEERVSVARVAPTGMAAAFDVQAADARDGIAQVSRDFWQGRNSTPATAPAPASAPKAPFLEALVAQKRAWFRRTDQSGFLDDPAGPAFLRAGAERMAA